MKGLSTILRFSSLQNICWGVVVLALLGQTFGSAITVANFIINRNYIAANLCVNRAMPMLKCNGKCQLAKKLKKEAEEQQSNISGKDFVWIAQVQCFQLSTPLAKPITKHYQLSVVEDLQDYTRRFFHPPSIV